MLKDVNSEAAVQPLVELSKQYDGHDRWYLEALGIGARGRENALYAKLHEAFPEKWNTKLGQLLWEYRPSDALPYLVASLNDATLTGVQKGEALDALAAMAALEAGNAVATLLASGNPPPELAEKA